MRHPLVFGPVLFAALGALGPAAAAPQIGVTSAVLPAARGTPPAAEPRVLQVGLDMQANERVQTDAEGKAQLLFLDGSALSIGPNSEVVLDEYVYDPVAKTGKIALSASRGVFRLVGGAISKTTPVTLRTPTATIGVRGGIAMASVGETTSAAFLFGAEMTVAGAGGSKQSANRPGFEITANPNGTVNPPLPLSERTLAGFSAMEGGAGQAAPGGPSVSDSDVASSQVSNLNSSVGAADSAPASGGGSGGGASPPLGEVADASQQQMTLAAVMSMGGDEGSPTDPEPDESPEDDGPPIGDGPVAPAFSPVGGPPAPTGLTLADVFVGRIKRATVPATGTNDNLAAENIPLLGQPGIVNGVFDARATPTTRLTIPAPAPNSFQFPVTSTAGPFGAAPLEGFASFTPDQQFLTFELEDSVTGDRVFAFAGVPTPPAGAPVGGVTYQYSLGQDFPRNVQLPFLEDIAFPVGGASPPPGYVVWSSNPLNRAFGAGAVAIGGQGPAQQSAMTVLNGIVLNDGSGRPFVAGFAFGNRRNTSDTAFQREFYSSNFSSVDADDGSDFFGPSANHFVLESSLVNGADAIVSRGGQKLVNGSSTPLFSNVPATGGAAFAATRTTRTLNGFANAIELDIDASGFVVGAHEFGNADVVDVSISTDATAIGVNASFKLFDANVGEDVDILFGGSSPSSTNAFIDDRFFFAGSQSVLIDGVSAGSGLLGLVTSSALQHNGFLPAGVSFCNCQYLTWGFFGGQRLATAPAGPEIAQAELGTWVVGLPSNAAQLVGIATQTATYSGHAIAGVVNGPDVYQAVGSIALTLSFGAGLYSLDSVTIANFDGFTLTGTNTAGPQFSGNLYTNVGQFTISGTKPGVGVVNANIKGAFFGPGTPPENTGGKVNMSGTGYKAAGTYAAARP